MLVSGNRSYCDRQMQVDISDLQDALKFVEKATGRPMAVSLNRAGRTAVIGAKGVKGAMQLTPKANKATIRKLDDRKIAGFVIKKMRAAGIKLTRDNIAEAVELAAMEDELRESAPRMTIEDLLPFCWEFGCQNEPEPGEGGCYKHMLGAF